MTQNDKEVARVALDGLTIGIVKLRTNRPKRIALKPILDEIRKTEASLESCQNDIAKAFIHKEFRNIPTLRAEEESHKKALSIKVKEFNKIFV